MKIEMYKNPEFGKLTSRFAIISLVMMLLTVICVHYRLFFCIFLVMSIGLVLIFFSIYRYSKFIYSRMHSLIFGVEKIMKGDYVELPEDKEGELYILSFQLNQMSKRLKLSAEKLEEEKIYSKRWISDVSHQLKTPISVLKMFNEIIASDITAYEPNVSTSSLNKDAVLEMLNKSSKQIENMEWLVGAILKLSRLESGMIPMNMVKEDINITIQQVTKELMDKIESKKQKLIVNVPKSSLYFLHDSKWIKEALKNILQNSITYTPEHGMITVELISGPSFIKIIMSDTGTGIPQKELPYIFERFYRGKNNPVNSNKVGTGIGLALAKLIVEKHNGIIEVESHEWKGTKIAMTFWGYLKVAEVLNILYNLVLQPLKSYFILIIHILLQDCQLLKMLQIIVQELRHQAYRV